MKDDFTKEYKEDTEKFLVEEYTNNVNRDVGRSYILICSLWQCTCYLHLRRTSLLCVLCALCGEFLCSVPS
jgi:hypothetical protein